MGGRVAVMVLGSTCAACALGSSHDPKDPVEYSEVDRWARESTVLEQCPAAPPNEKEPRSPCGLLVDKMPPAEASGHFVTRYPYASMADLKGTCALDVTCNVRAREILWLSSHNRNVARRADEARGRYAKQRHHDDAEGRALGYILAGSMVIVSAAFGATR